MSGLAAIGPLRGGWMLTALHLVCFLFCLGVFGAANAMLDYVPMALILWALPLVAAIMVGVGAVGANHVALPVSARIGLAIRFAAILLALGAGLSWAGRNLGNLDLMVYGFPGNALIGQVLLPGAALFALSCAGLWLGGKIALLGQSGVAEN